MAVLEGFAGGAIAAVFVLAIAAMLVARKLRPILASVAPALALLQPVKVHPTGAAASTRSIHSPTTSSGYASSGYASSGHAEPVYGDPGEGLTVAPALDVAEDK